MWHPHVLVDFSSFLFFITISLIACIILQPSDSLILLLSSTFTPTIMQIFLSSVARASGGLLVMAMFYRPMLLSWKLLHYFHLSSFFDFRLDFSLADSPNSFIQSYLAFYILFLNFFFPFLTSSSFISYSGILSLLLYFSVACFTPK